MKTPVDQTSSFRVRDRILRQAEVEAKVGFEKTKLFEKIGAEPSLHRLLLDRAPWGGGRAKLTRGSRNSRGHSAKTLA
jgi:hypothetical protein